MSDIANRVKEIIVDKLTVDENEVTPTAEFSKDLGADSLDRLLMHLLLMVLLRGEFLNLMNILKLRFRL